VDLTEPSQRVADDATDRLYRYWRVRVMYAMMVGYATFYFVRNNMAMATKPITDEFHFTNTQWGSVLGTATIVYGISKFLSGVLADIIKPKYIMALGLFVSAVASIVFGFGHRLSFFLTLWIINNLFQGMGMTPCSRLITFWFSPRELGRAWGIWNASHQMGGAIIYLVAGYLVANYGWRSAFWVPGAFALFISIWLLNRLPHSPESIGLPPVEQYQQDGIPVAADPDAAGLTPWQNFRDNILRNRWVWVVSVGNFFVYVVRIGILSWGPKYLQESKGFTIGQSAWTASAFEVAGIFGAYGAGWLSDRTFQGRRGPVSVLFMLLLTAAILGLLAVPHGNVGAMVGIFILLGFFVYGPQLLVAVAAADFATKKASATAVGLTGLFGYMGASACSLITGKLADQLGWNAVVWFYVAAAMAGALLLATTWNRRSPLLTA
jgi:phosphoglycerate transporter family protein